MNVKHPEYFQNLSDDIAQFISPIEKFGINFFSHCRLYPDGSRTDLTNLPDINKKYYCPKLKLFEVYTPEANSENINSDFIYLGNPENDLTIQMMRETNNVTHVLSMIDKRSNSTDVFNFGMPKEAAQPLESYMRGFSALKLFVSDFLINFEKKITLDKNDRILIDSPHNITNENIVITGLLKRIESYILDEDKYINKLKKIYIGNDIWLTNSQFRIIYLLHHGFHPHKISDILSISKKSVNKHLSQICFRIDANDNYHLLSTLREKFIFSDSVVFT